MAHFAQLDENNIVTQVIVVANSELLDNGAENEAKGIAFCHGLLGGNWIQTSYSKAFRKNFAGVGHTYDAQRDAFIPPQSYPSWILIESTCQWEPPVPYPTDGKVYIWDEPTKNWVEPAQV
jgi:hypothetical protein